MKWFRLYTDIIDDPKMNHLSDGEHRRFIHCLAVAADQEKEGKIEGTLVELSWRIRSKPLALQSTIEKLISLNILKQIENGWEFINWKKRQYRSDDVTERVRKHRMKRFRNVSVTVNETAPETEQRQSRENTPISPRGPNGSFDLFWKAYPKKTGKGAAERAWRKIRSPSEVLQKILSNLEWQKKSEQWVKNGGQYIPNPSTYLNETRWEDEEPTLFKPTTDYDPELGEIR